MHDFVVEILRKGETESLRRARCTVQIVVLSCSFENCDRNTSRFDCSRRRLDVLCLALVALAFLCVFRRIRLLDQNAARARVLVLL